MPRRPTSYTTPLSMWCKETGTSILKISKDTGLAYKTCHLAFHGYKINYDSAVIILNYTKNSIPLSSMCECKPRKEYERLTE